MELWDIYDENRAATGRTHVRGVPLGKGEYHLVADIWTVNQKNLILLTRRHPDKPYGLMWECSGGSVLAGETSAEGALRELLEETGIHADKEDLKLIHSIRQKERFVDTYITRQDITIEDVKLQKEEVVDARLVTFNELLDLWKQEVVVPKSRFLLYKDSIREFINPPS
ncbi:MULTISPECIES: NUDIX domain-containing protein [Lacrimispora]|jgi:8-oxo-dGTP pyrophosphatase MutT (NUDIX family)|uniref:NUDIX hydrolase n=1 Tax=Lacrimispora TaxID=2719231 RepID=UPI000BE25183|nr:NUDIX domain-containing protein [Lacrimispora amygdalina]MDK2964879.1 8-oxo-dGTP diphosphatase [Lacrimispora sp.]